MHRNQMRQLQRQRGGAAAAEAAAVERRRPNLVRAKAVDGRSAFRFRSSIVSFVGLFPSRISRFHFKKIILKFNYFTLYPKNWKF